MILRHGDAGPAVAEVRARLADLGWNVEPVGDQFTDDLDLAVRGFQQERGITVDGIIGPETFARLDEARWHLGDRVLAFRPGHLIIGDDVAELQRRLNELGFAAGRVDGRFGRQTDEALREFQKGVGVTADGTCGPDTFRAFDRLVRTVSGGNANRLRDHLTLTELRSGIADKVIMIDPGSDIDPVVTHALAVRIEGRLAALGTQVLLSRPAHNSVAASVPTDKERAAFANEMGVDIVLSLHVDTADSPLPNGIATFYFGDPRGGNHSTSGRVLAELVQDELQSRTDIQDCRTHPRTWDLLRYTRMPAVRVVVGYVSNPHDAQRLNDPLFHDLLAEGLVSALTRFCAPR